MATTVCWAAIFAATVHVGVWNVDEAPFDWRVVAAEIAPKPHESVWRQIDWQTSLRAARRLAVEQKKPLLVWQMDGHPLGCT